MVRNMLVPRLVVIPVLNLQSAGLPMRDPLAFMTRVVLVWEMLTVLPNVLMTLLWVALPLLCIPRILRLADRVMLSLVPEVVSRTGANLLRPDIVGWNITAPHPEANVPSTLQVMMPWLPVFLGSVTHIWAMAMTPPLFPTTNMTGIIFYRSGDHRHCLCWRCVNWKSFSGDVPWGTPCKILKAG